MELETEQPRRPSEIEENFVLDNIGDDLFSIRACVLVEIVAQTSSVGNYEEAEQEGNNGTTDHRVIEIWNGGGRRIEQTDLYIPYSSPKSENV